VEESAPPTERDIGDGRPSWNPRPGEPLVPGLLAWDRMAIGHRRETWLCWSVDLWAPAVVKIVRPGWARSWTEALDREVRALGNVAHPAVPRLLADGRENCLPHIAIEYLDGPALDECVEADGPLPAGDIARLGVLVLGALKAVHAAGNAHLDVSPYNVLLVDRRPRLIDLGTARPLGYELEAGEAIGTDGFLAPEFRDAPGGAITAALDVYGVGATLASLLDPSSDGADRVADRLAALTADDPDRRPGIDLAMSSLAPSAGTGASRPWPAWATRHLPPPPRRRRLRRAQPDRIVGVA
jgi:eukaryotic-like serine/threonine-protein kinase